MRNLLSRLTRRKKAGHTGGPCLRAVGQERVIIVHNHIFKNAGTTIDWALQQNFDGCFVDHRDDTAMCQSEDYLRSYLAEHEHVQAFSSHHIRPPLPDIKGARLLSLMMFRHPIERATSVYNFEKKQTNSSTKGARYASTHNLREYVEWRMQFDVPPTIRNFHTYRSLPRQVQSTRPLDESEYEQARTYIHSLPLLGVVERFDESMVLFEDTLRKYYPGIDLSYAPQNVNQVPRSMQERLGWLREEVGDDVYALLCARNEMDMALYGEVVQVLEQRLSGVIDLPGRLDDFKRRCACK